MSARFSTIERVYLPFGSGKKGVAGVGGVESSKENVQHRDFVYGYFSKPGRKHIEKKY
jgi:hypothetical protein